MNGIGCQQLSVSRNATRSGRKTRLRQLANVITPPFVSAVVTSHFARRSYSLQTSTANVTPEAKGQISHRRRITPLYEQKKTAGRKRTSAASSRTSLLAGIGKALATSSTLEDVGQIPLERGFKDSVSKDMLVENLYVSRLEMILN